MEADRENNGKAAGQAEEGLEGRERERKRWNEEVGKSRK